MDETGTAPVVTDSSAPAPATDTVVDTAPAADHTPDYVKAVETIEKNWENIPDDARQRINKHFQPAFNRNLNLIRDRVNTALTEAGIPIPEGKTGADLLFDGNGKGFFDAIRATVRSEVAPVLDQAARAKQSQVLNQMVDSAVQANPDIKPYVKDAIAEIDQNADLTKMALMGEGAGLFYVLQGVAERRARMANDAKVKELTSILEANKIAVKTGGGTSKAGSGAPKPTAPAKPKTLAEAAAMALEKVKADLAAEG